MSLRCVGPSRAAERCKSHGLSYDVASPSACRPCISTKIPRLSNFTLGLYQPRRIPRCVYGGSKGCGTSCRWQHACNHDAMCDVRHVRPRRQGRRGHYRQPLTPQCTPAESGTPVLVHMSCAATGGRGVLRCTQTRMMSMHVACRCSRKRGVRRWRRSGDQGAAALFPGVAGRVESWHPTFHKGETMRLKGAKLARRRHVVCYMCVEGMHAVQNGCSTTPPMSTMHGDRDADRFAELSTLAAETTNGDAKPIVTSRIVPARCMCVICMCSWFVGRPPDTTMPPQDGMGWCGGRSLPCACGSTALMLCRLSLVVCPKCNFVPAVPALGCSRGSIIVLSCVRLCSDVELF